MHYYVVGLPIPKKTSIPSNNSDSKHYFPKGQIELFTTQEKAEKKAKNLTKDNKKQLKKEKKSKKTLQNSSKTTTPMRYPIFKIDYTAENNSNIPRFIDAQAGGIEVLKIYLGKDSINLKNPPSSSDLKNPRLTNTTSSLRQRPLFLARAAIFIVSLFLYFQHSVIKTKDELLYYGIIPQGNAFIGIPLLLGIAFATAYSCLKIFDGIISLGKWGINYTKNLLAEKTSNSDPAFAPAPAVIPTSNTAAPTDVAPDPTPVAPLNSSFNASQDPENDLEAPKTLVFSRIKPSSISNPKDAPASSQNEIYPSKMACVLF